MTSDRHFPGFPVFGWTFAKRAKSIVSDGINHPPRALIKTQYFLISHWLWPILPRPKPSSTTGARRSGRSSVQRGPKPIDALEEIEADTPLGAIEQANAMLSESTLRLNVLPLLAAQRGLWVAHALASSEIDYNV